jgi:RimJ/RimL family protein N-acetyltransferase
MVKVIELETKRLKLRQWKENDFPLFAKLNADENVMRYFPSTLTEKKSYTMAEKIQTLITKKGWGFWAVEEKVSGTFIGYVGLHQPSLDLPFTPCVEIGWRLAKEYWGKGYATEASREVLRFGFDTLGLDEILSFTAVINQPSRAVMERLGMRYCQKKNFDHPAVPVGSELREHVLYRLTREEFFQ